MTELVKYWTELLFLSGNSYPSIVLPDQSIVPLSSVSAGAFGIVNTIAARDIYPVALRRQGMMLFCLDVQCYYSLAADLTTWYFAFPSQALATQTDWYVAPTGNDNNTGLIGSPLATTEEVNRRTNPLELIQDVTIHIASGTYLNATFKARSGNENVNTLYVVCEVTSGPSITLQSVVNPAASTKTRGQLTSTGGSFVSRKRIRVTSGTSVRAISYSTSLADGTTCFHSGFIIPEYGAFHITSDPVAGDTCVQDTLGVILRRVELDAHPNARIVLKDAQIIRTVVNGVPESTPSGDAGGNVIFSGCEAIGISSIWQNNAGGACLFGCNWTTATKTVLSGFSWLNWGSVVHGLMAVSNGSVSSYGLCIDGGQLLTNVEANFEFKSNQGASRFTAEQSYNGTGTLEIENGGNAFGAGAAINVLCGGEFVNAGRGANQAEIWGASGVYAIFCYISAGGHVFQQEFNGSPNFLANFDVPSTVNWKIAGTNYAFTAAAIPVPNSDSGVIATV